jgi:hypothetical protein
VTPRAHYYRGFALGGVIFFSVPVAFVVTTFIPVQNRAPITIQLVQFLARHGLPEWLGFATLFFGAFGLSVGGAEFTRWAFRRLVPAQCPQCGENAYGQGRWPVIYVCRSCGHTHDTGIREGEEG